MACCAFAVFVLFYLLAPLGLFGRRRRLDKRRNAAAWRRAAQASPPGGNAGLSRRKLAATTVVAILTLQLTVLGAAYLYLHHDDAYAVAAGPVTDPEWDAFAALHTVWCLDEGVNASESLEVGAPWIR